jgi:hypothetical protein
LSVPQRGLIYVQLVQDKQAIRNLLKEQFHVGVSPEILRELNHGRSRGEKGLAENAMSVHTRIGPLGTEDVFQMAPVVVDEMEF